MNQTPWQNSNVSDREEKPPPSILLLEDFDQCSVPQSRALAEHYLELVCGDEIAARTLVVASLIDGDRVPTAGMIADNSLGCGLAYWILDEERMRLKFALMPEGKAALRAGVKRRAREALARYGLDPEAVPHDPFAPDKSELFENELAHDVAEHNERAAYRSAFRILARRLALTPAQERELISQYLPPTDIDAP